MAIIAEIIITICIGIGLALVTIVAISALKKVFTSVTDSMTKTDSITISRSEYDNLMKVNSELKEQVEKLQFYSGMNTGKTTARRSRKTNV